MIELQKKMFVKLKSVVFFVKFITSLLSSRRFGNVRDFYATRTYFRLEKELFKVQNLLVQLQLTTPDYEKMRHCFHLF